jgi:beta-phosphoglucomutase-like phosphatase (HAD superfamily)
MTKAWPHPICAVIFDNDDTLMNTDWVYHIAHKEVTGYDLEWNLKQKLMGKTPIEACRITCAHHNLSESPESLCARRTAVESRYWPSIPLMPGAMALVQAVAARGIRQSIATASTKTGFALKSTGNRAIVDAMDHVICADDVNPREARAGPVPRGAAQVAGHRGGECPRVRGLATRNRGGEPRGDAGSVRTEPAGGSG